MSFPTLQEIQQLVLGQDPNVAKRFEYAHKMQLYYLWQAGTFCQNTATKFQELGNKLTQQQVQAYQQYLLKVKDLYLSWLTIQQQMENASTSIQKLNLTGGDIFTPTGLNKIKNILKQWNPNAEIKTLGWIPLVIGSASALLAIWGFYQISVRFTTTVEDKIKLLKATEETVQKLGLTPEQASELIGQTQKEASQSSGIMDTLKWGLIAYLGITVAKNFMSNGK